MTKTDYSAWSCFSGFISSLILILLWAFQSPWWCYLLWVVLVIIVQVFIFLPLYRNIRAVNQAKLLGGKG